MPRQTSGLPSTSVGKSHSYPTRARLAASKCRKFRGGSPATSSVSSSITSARSFPGGSPIARRTMLPTPSAPTNTRARKVPPSLDGDPRAVHCHTADLGPFAQIDSTRSCDARERVVVLDSSHHASDRPLALGDQSALELQRNAVDGDRGHLDTDADLAQQRVASRAYPPGAEFVARIMFFFEHDDVGSPPPRGARTARWRAPRAPRRR